LNGDAAFHPNLCKTFFVEWNSEQMAADLNGGELPGWLVTLGASALTAVGGFALALVNRGPAMQSAVDGRLRTLIDGYERRVDDLTLEVHCLREEVVNLRRALAESHFSTGFGA
jgi:hypothetical protein